MVSRWWVLQHKSLAHLTEPQNSLRHSTSHDCHEIRKLQDCLTGCSSKYVGTNVTYHVSPSSAKPRPSNRLHLHGSILILIIARSHNQPIQLRTLLNSNCCSTNVRTSDWEILNKTHRHLQPQKTGSCQSKFKSWEFLTNRIWSFPPAGSHKTQAKTQRFNRLPGMTRCRISIWHRYWWLWYLQFQSSETVTGSETTSINSIIIKHNKTVLDRFGLFCSTTIISNELFIRSNFDGCT